MIRLYKEEVILLCAIGLVVALLIFNVYNYSGTNPKDKVKDMSSVFEEICLDGVSYWYSQVGYGLVLTPKYNRDGHIQFCDKGV